MVMKKYNLSLISLNYACYAKKEPKGHGVCNRVLYKESTSPHCCSDSI